MVALQFCYTCVRAYKEKKMKWSTGNLELHSSRVDSTVGKMTVLNSKCREVQMLIVLVMLHLNYRKQPTRVKR